MKRIIYLSIMFMMTSLLVACNNALEKSTRAITSMQDEVAKIVNELNEIQLLELNLQSSFESTIAENDDLTQFNNDTNPVAQNIQNRKSHLQTLKQANNALVELSKEFDTLSSNENLPQEQLNAIKATIEQLNHDLTTYMTDYDTNLSLESQSFRSIANPNSDYKNFFEVLNNINKIALTNAMNLEPVLQNFESLNTQLINTKVTLVNLAEHS